MTHKKIFISAIVITKNESPRIVRCLKSLSFVDELIVIDNGSTDDTVSLATKQGAHVIDKSGADFAALRNVGCDMAAGKWILYIDADETVTDGLRTEIENTIHNKNEEKDINPDASDLFPNAYYICRRNFYLGKEWPTRDKMVRLIKKESLKKWEGILHEHPVIDGNISELHEPLIHDTHRTIAEMTEKTNEWSVREAQLRFDAHHPTISWWRLLRVMITAFWDSFVRQQGWKAGTVGWIESLFQAFSMFITYAKLWELQQH